MKKKHLTKKSSKDLRENNAKLATAILLNRILQRPKSPQYKTRKQIAEKYGCGLSKVGRAERYILDRLIEKVAVLKIIIKID